MSFLPPIQRPPDVPKPRYWSFLTIIALLVWSLFSTIFGLDAETILTAIYGDNWRINMPEYIRDFLIKNYHILPPVFVVNQFLLGIVFIVVFVSDIHRERKFKKLADDFLENSQTTLTEIQEIAISALDQAKQKEKNSVALHKKTREMLKKWRVSLNERDNSSGPN